VELIADSLDQLAQLVHLAVGEAPGRFIEQEQLGPRRERPGQLDALERAEGQSLALWKATSSRSSAERMS